MASIIVRGSGHQDDPFQILLTLTDRDIADARAPESIVVEPDIGYGADPQIRTVIVQVADD
jgi:hypothetical protein